MAKPTGGKQGRHVAKRRAPDQKRKPATAKQMQATGRSVFTETALSEAGVCDVPITGLAHVASLTIADLGLVDYAQDAAVALLAAHPNVVFTSGRRSVKQQADAMAGNIEENRQYIE